MSSILNSINLFISISFLVFSFSFSNSLILFLSIKKTKNSLEEISIKYNSNISFIEKCEQQKITIEKLIQENKEIKNEIEIFHKKNLAEKLSNFRRENKHMTQIPQQIDKPDILFGLNEYKEINKSSKSTRFHSIKKLKSCNSSPDLPDILHPLTEDF